MINNLRVVLPGSYDENVIFKKMLLCTTYHTSDAHTFPPPHDFMPSPTKVRPMSITVIPVMIGGNILLRYIGGAILKKI